MGIVFVLNIGSTGMEARQVALAIGYRYESYLLLYTARIPGMSLNL